jgi:hypothetical protein
MPLPKKVENIQGLRSGKWEALEFSHVHGSNAYWLCVCDCGTRRPVMAGNIKRKRTKPSADT